MRRVAIGVLFVIISMFGLGSVASADPGVTVEPVTASSPDRSQITFTNGGVAAKVNYGRARNDLTNSVSLVPNQVITVSVKDADTIYWQANSAYGTSSVHKKETVNNGWFVFVMVVAIFWVIAIAAAMAY